MTLATPSGGILSFQDAAECVSELFHEAVKSKSELLVSDAALELYSIATKAHQVDLFLKWFYESTEHASVDDVMRFNAVSAAITHLRSSLCAGCNREWGRKIQSFKAMFIDPDSVATLELALGSLRAHVRIMTIASGSTRESMQARVADF